MKTLTGVTTDTKGNIQFGAGVFTNEYTEGGTIPSSAIIGATRDGGNFSAIPTIRQIEADGLPTYTKDFNHIDEWVVTMSTKMIEFKKEVLLLTLGGAAKDTVSGQVTKITASNEISSESYKDIFWIGNLIDGRKAVIKLKNAQSLGGLNYTINNKGEGTYAVTLTAHYDIADLDTAPFEILIDGTNVTQMFMSGGIE